MGRKPKDHKSSDPTEEAPEDPGAFSANESDDDFLNTDVELTSVADIPKKAKPEKPKPKKEKSPGRVSALKAFAANASKRWGKSIAVGDSVPIMTIPRQSTGNFGLDIAMFGGLPPGISMFFGAPRSTKTGSCLNAAAEWQKRCGHCYELECDCSDREPAGVLWVDAEGKTSDSLMMPWMEGHGLDLSSVLIERPDSGNEIVDVVDAAIRNGIKFVVVDSIANMTSKDEITKAAEDGQTVGRGAMLGNSAMRKWVQAQVQWGFQDEIAPRILIINQIRQSMNQYAPDALPGGLGQKYAARIAVKFHATPSRRRYRVVKADGSFTDLQKPPHEDSHPSYQETDFRVTESSQCPSGLYGSYNYWMTAAHGRRKGDPDNAAQMVVKMRYYNFFTRTKGGWCIQVPEEWAESPAERVELCKGAIQDEVIQAFRTDFVAQALVWKVMVRKLTKV